MEYKEFCKAPYKERRAYLRKRVQEEVEERLKGRKDSGALKDELDFLMGASTVLAVCNMVMFGVSEEESMDLTPPRWIFAPMRGESILEEEKEDDLKIAMITTSSSNGTKLIKISEKEPSYEELKDMVGGYIQVVQTANGDDMVINEEGKLLGLPINSKATELYVGEEYDDTCASWDFDTINGDAVVLTGKAKLS